MGTPIAWERLIPPGAVVGIDTAPFIYYVEGHAQFGPPTTELFESLIDTGRNTAVTSVVTLAEVLVGALRAGHTDIAQRYAAILRDSRNLTLAPISPAVAEQAAHLRIAQQVRLPDALEIAAAQMYGAAIFVTNDETLRRVTALQVITLRDVL